MTKMAGKAWFVVLVLAVGLSGCPKPTPPPDPLQNKTYTLEYKGPKKRVGIVKFDNKASYAKKKRVGEAIVDIVTTELAKTKAFIVVERAELDKVLQEQALGQSGAVNPATAAKAGRVLGLQSLLIGTISEFGVTPSATDLVLFKQKKQEAKATVDVRLIDATTGQILYADSGSGAGSVTYREFLGMGAKGGYDESLEQFAVRSAVVQFMQNLINQLGKTEWYGKVVKANAGEGTAIVNAGQETGLNVGDKIVVNTLGETLTDPDTGMELGQELGPVVGELEVVSFFGRDAAKCKIVSGRSTIQAGQQVSLKK
ncbi:MAG: CsgG/HfaB family protein [Bdellovibrionota bacterium]